jgi:hypothetical protein
VRLTMRFRGFCQTGLIFLSGSPRWLPRIRSWRLDAAVLGLASFKQANVIAALGAAREASRLAVRATERERRHAEAVEVWAHGEPGRAAAIWEAVLREAPHDVLAFRLVHFLRFWQGRPDLMLRAVEEAEQGWAPEPWLTADAGQSRSVHRRAERCFDAVPTAVAGHGCGRAVGGAGRVGGVADWRLRFRVYPSALDDGAGRSGAVRCGGAVVGDDARVQRREPGGGGGSGKLRAAGERGGTGVRERLPRCVRCWEGCLGWAAAMHNRTYFISCSWTRR